MKKIVVFLLFLFVFFSVSAKSKFNETAIKGELRKPGVKLVAIDFYMTGCPPCDAAIPVWKKLKKEYGDALKLIVVAPQRDDGSCTVKDWHPDKTVCDEDMEIAGSWGVKDFPQAFLYSWHNNDPLVKLGHVKDVEKAIKEYFKSIPRVALDADKNSQNLLPMIEEALITNSKIEVVANESEREQLITLRKESHKLKYDEDSRCELGKEIAANSILKITKQGETLSLKLSSAEKSCTMAAATKMLSGNKGKLKTEIASAVYDLLSQMFGDISTPENREKSGTPQSFLSQNGSNLRESKACQYAQKEDSLEAWQAYLDMFPDGDCSFEAKGKIKKLEWAKLEPYIKKGRVVGNLIWSDRSEDAMNWNEAVDHCKYLIEGGYSDWRLPNIDELRTIITNCPLTEIDGDCAISEKHHCLSDNCIEYCSCTEQDNSFYSKFEEKEDEREFQLWSSSAYSDTVYVWVVNFSFGQILNEDKQTKDYYRHGRSYYNTVRCVRSVPTIETKSSGNLHWSNEAPNKMGWNDATNYCKNLNDGGHSDWRLPNIDELRTLIQNHPNTQTGGSCPISEKLGKLAWSDRTSDCDGRNSSNLRNTNWFWSSSVTSGDSNGRWVVGFGSGSVGRNHVNGNSGVRCVRGKE